MATTPAHNGGFNALTWFLIGAVPALIFGLLFGPRFSHVLITGTVTSAEILTLGALILSGLIGTFGGWTAASKLHHRVVDRDLETIGCWVDLLAQNAFDRSPHNGAGSPSLDALAPHFSRAAANVRERFTTYEEHARTLAHQAAALAAAQTELEQVNYIVAHHLQEPLIRITTYLDMFGRHMRGKLDPPAARFLSSVHSGVRRIGVLIDDLTLYSRSVYGPPDLYETDTAALVKSIIEELDIEIIESGAEITVGELPTVWANPDELTKVFRHLIANAIRFRRSEVPRVVISGERGDQRTIFHVRDNGIGVDPHYLPHLFRVFERVHTDPAYVGSGIGLAVCKKVVEHHGGEISVASALGEGATFSFSIPDRPLPAPRPSPPENTVH